MNNILARLGVAAGAGMIATGLSFVYTPVVTSAGCGDVMYHTRGFPLQYYQEQLPASCVNPGGPAFPDAQSIREYFGRHFYWITFIIDMLAWSLACLAVLVSIRAMQGGRT